MASLLASSRPAVGGRIWSSGTRGLFFSTGRSFRADPGSTATEVGQSEKFETGTDDHSDRSRAERGPLIRRVKEHTPYQRRARQQFGPLSLEADRLEKDIVRGVIDPKVALQENISKGRADADVVAACLRGAMISATTTRPDLLCSNIASLVLQHIWKDSQLWSQFVYAHPHAMFYLCRFAVAENLDQILVEWLFVQDQALIPTRANTRRDSYWRSSLLAKLADAYFLRDRNLNSAIMLLFRVMDRHKSLASHESVKIQPQAASTRVCQHLLKHTAADGTDYRLFDRFKRFYTLLFRKMNKEIGHELDMIHLECVHPTKPQYLPAVHYLSGLKKEDLAVTNASHDLNYHVQKIIQTALSVAEKANDQESVKRLKEMSRRFS